MEKQGEATNDQRQATRKKRRPRPEPKPLKPEPRRTYPEDNRFISAANMVFFSRGTMPPSVRTWTLGVGVLASAMMGGAAALGSYYLLLKLASPHGMGPVGMHLKGMAAAALHSLPPHWGTAWNAWREAAEPAAKAASAGWAALAMATGALAGRMGWKLTTVPADGNMHVNGRRLLDNEEAMREWIALSAMERQGRPKPLLKKIGAFFTFGKPPEIDHETDIDMVPGVPMASSRMGKHGLFLGPPGSGKTVVQAPMIDRAIRGGHRIMAFDIKGDFTELFYKETFDPDNAEGDVGKECPDNQVVLLAPYDKRSHIWDIAADVRSKQDAKAFAESNIEVSDKDPMWGNLARAVVVGCIHMLQVEKPGTWGFSDLADLLAMTNMKFFIAIMKKFNEEGLRAVDTADVTAAGVMSNVMAGMAPLFDLADAWPSRVKGRMFSVREWATAEGPKLKSMRKAVILKGSPEFPDLTRATAGSIFQIAQSVVTSLKDSPTRRIYFLLDEFPTLGKVNIKTLITLGRSKGARVWLGLQTLHQFKEVHGEDVANALKNSVSTFVSLGATGPEAEEISSLIGERTVERMVTSGTGANMSTSPQSATIKTIMPAQLALVGERKPYGVKALVWGKGIDNALLLGFPYPSDLANPVKKKDNARANVIADWTKAEGSKALGKARALRQAQGRAFLTERMSQWSVEDPSDEKLKELLQELNPMDEAEKRRDAYRKSVGLPTDGGKSEQEPNHTDPDKKFIPTDRGDAERTAEERKLWSKAKLEKIRSANAGMDNKQGQKKEREEGAGKGALREQMIKAREARESGMGAGSSSPAKPGGAGDDWRPEVALLAAAVERRDEERKEPTAPAEPKPKKTSGAEGDEGGGSALDQGMGPDFSSMLASATTADALERLAEEAEGAGDAEVAKRVRAKLTLAKMAKASGREGRQATLSTEAAARKAGGKTIQDGPTWVANPIAATVAAARAKEGPEGEEDPIGDALGEHAQVTMLSSILGLHLAEVVVHAVSAAEKLDVGSALPSMVPVWAPPRKTGG